MHMCVHSPACIGEATGKRRASWFITLPCNRVSQLTWRHTGSQQAAELFPSPPIIVLLPWACTQPHLAFYTGSGGSNSGPHDCTVSTLTHWAISLVFLFVRLVSWVFETELLMHPGWPWTYDLPLLLPLKFLDYRHKYHTWLTFLFSFSVSCVTYNWFMSYVDKI